jgi:hypothetical protein
VHFPECSVSCSYGEKFTSVTKTGDERTDEIAILNEARRRILLALQDIEAMLYDLDREKIAEEMEE